MPKLPGDNTQSVTLRHYPTVLRRRKWTIAAAMVIQNRAANLTGVTDPTLNQQADRVAQTQADLALADGGRLPSGEKEDAALLESER